MPLTSARLFAPKVVCSEVYLYRLLSTTCGMTPFLSSMTRRRPFWGGLVTHVGDALDALLVHEARDLLLQGALVHHVGDLSEHQAVATRLGGLDMRLGTHGDGAAAGLVGLADAVGAHDEGAVGKSGPGMICMSSSTVASGWSMR